MSPQLATNSPQPQSPLSTSYHSLSSPRPHKPPPSTVPLPQKLIANLTNSSTSSETNSETNSETLTPPPPIIDANFTPLLCSPNFSSPRRPRRVPTSIPPTTPSRKLDEFDFCDSPNHFSARDEFEEKFLSREFHDNESQLISNVLEAVHFHQLDDDEEMLSDDAADSARGIAAAKAANATVQHTPDFYRRARAASRDGHHHANRRSNWSRVRTEVGIDGCPGCDRLCGENTRLRRQLDELEFEVASSVVRESTDSVNPSAKPVPAQDDIEVLRKKKSWTSRLRYPTRASNLSSGPGSERTRLRSEVKALTVTTEYLWRKLNQAEIELRDFKKRELRTRMKRNKTSRDIGLQADLNDAFSADDDSTQ